MTTKTRNDALNINHIAAQLSKAMDRIEDCDAPGVEWATANARIMRTADRLVRTAKAIGVPLPTDADK